MKTVLKVYTLICFDLGVPVKHHHNQENNSPKFPPVPGNSPCWPSMYLLLPGNHRSISPIYFQKFYINGITECVSFVSGGGIQGSFTHNYLEIHICCCMY